MCVSDIASCTRNCSTATPIKCWNGECATSSQSCPCNTSFPFRCSTDLQCYDSATSCPCQNTASVRCPANPRVCVSDLTKCSALAVCDADEVQCHDGSCKGSILSCSCSANDTAGTLPIITINAVALSTFDVTRPLRVSSSVTYSVCGSDRSSAVSVTWSVTDTVTSAAVPVAGRNNKLSGQTLVLDANVFPTAGRSLTFIAVARIGNTSASASVVLVTSLPTITLVFVGGSSRTVTASSAPTLFVQVGNDPQTVVSAGAWSCQNASGTPCPKNISKALLSETSNQVFLPRTIEAGSYVVAFTYGNVTVSQDLNVVLTSGATVEIVRSVTTSNENLALFANVQNADSRCSIAWLLNGSTISKEVLADSGASRALLVVKRSGFSTGDEHTFTVAATCSGSVATASYVLVLQALPTLTCSVTTNDATTSIVTALVTSIHISATLSGATDATPMYRFGYIDSLAFSREDSHAAGRSIPLSSTVQSLASLDVTAPRPTTSSSVQSVKFFVGVQLGDQVDAVRATCAINITMPPANATQVITGQTTMMQDAIHNNDTTSVLRSAASLTAAANSDGDSSRRAQLKSQVMTALNSAVQNATQVLSTDQRSAAVQTLAALVVNRTMSQRDEDDCVNTVHRLVSHSTGLDTSFNVQQDGTAALQVLNAVNMTPAVAEVATTIAHAFAATSPLGERVTVNSTHVAVASTALPATQVAGTNLTSSSGNSSISLPASLPVFQDASSASVVAVTATEYATNPYGTVGLSNTTNISSTVVDYTLVQDGAAANVTDLTEPINITIAVSGNVTSTSALDCVYYNPDNATWDTTNVTTVAYDPTTNSVTCQTTHLSTFAVASNAGASAGSPAGGAAAASKALGVGPIAGIVLGCVVVVAIIAWKVVFTKKQQTPPGKTDGAILELEMFPPDDLRPQVLHREHETL